MTAVRRHEIIAGIALGVVFLLPLLVDGPFDNEEGALGVFSSQVHYQHLLRGEWLFWLKDLGFGTPLPVGHRLDFHPVFALAGVTSLRIALSALWLVHVTVMVVYFLRLAAVSGICPPLRLALLAFYVFSASSVCWFYQTDWVTFVIGWTTYPVLLFYLRQTIRGEADTNFWLAAVRLALVFGFLILNSHPGYIAPLVLTLLVYTLAAAPVRWPVYRCLVVAFVLCVALTAERLYFFASEMQLFPAPLGRYTQPEYRPMQYAAAAIAPLTPVDDDMRLPFLGLVLVLAALVGVVRIRSARDEHARACVVAFVAALGMSLAPHRFLSLWIGSSGAWLFRDPMVFFGLLTGGIVLQREIDSPTLRRPAFVWLLLAVQTAQQGATVWYGFRDYGAHRGMLGFYRHQKHLVGLGLELAAQGRTFGPRLYMSEQAHGLMRAALSPYGIHFVTDLVFLGLNPVNAWFKVVSMDRLHPSIGLMHGHIGGQRDVIANGRLLDVLGIDMVLTTEGEGGAPPGLRPLARTHVSTFAGEHDLVLLANPDAWPRAVLLDASARTVALPLRAGCGHDRALCRDFTALAEKRIADRVSLAEGNGRYTVRLTPADRERLLFVSAAYRPEWRADSPAGALRVEPIAGAFLGVTVPAGVQEVDLAFVPRVRIALTWLGGLTMVVVLAVFGAATWLRARGARASAAEAVGVGR